MMNFNGIKSKKLIVTMLAAIAMIVNAVLGHPVDDNTVYAVLGLFGTYVIGQGIADNGKQGAAKAAERALAKGPEVSNAVQGVLGGRAGFVVSVDDYDEGPDWEDTTEEDEEDKPKDLNG